MIKRPKLKEVVTKEDQWMKMTQTSTTNTQLGEDCHHGHLGASQIRAINTPSSISLGCGDFYKNCF